MKQTKIKMHRFLLSLLFLCLFTFQTEAQRIFQAGQDDKLEAEYAYVFVDSTKQLTFEQINDPSAAHKFVKHNREDLNFGYEHNNIWLRFQIENTSPFDDFVLVQYLSSVDYVTLYGQDNSNIWQQTIIGDRLAFSERAVENRFFVFPLELKKDKINTFYIKAQTETSAQLPIHILRRSEFNQETVYSEMAYGFFYGMLGVMFLYNLFVFFAIRDFAYLFYVLNVAATFFFVACLVGHLNVFVFQNTPLIANYFMPIASAILMLTSSAFLLTFLEVPKYAKNWKYVLYVQMIIAVLIMLSCTFMGYGKMTELINSIAFVSTIMNVVIAVICWRNGNPSAKFYLLAFGAYISGILIIAFRNAGLLPLNALTLHSIEIGPSIELILLSLALSDKINRYRKEKEEATRLALKVEKDAKENLETKVEERTQQLQRTLDLVGKEREKSDKLLLNILPADTAQELKETGKATPKQYDMATVLFTDFKDFTRITRDISVEQIIENLNTCFRAFDEICEKHKLEKIKTIGDSYMCVGGVPTRNKTNALDAVLTGLEMQKWVKEWGKKQKAAGEEPWTLRVGIHTGSVIAGVVGKDKFAYDIWGDTVNMASRMETKGEIGRVNISSTTYAIIKDKFDCSYRGKVSVKNSGETEMYFVENQKYWTLDGRY